MALPPQTRLTDEERANLVAFLDGELDDVDAQKFEEKSARSISIRKELTALEKTWNMLDWLPRPEAPGDFASQTISRIHSQAIRAELIEGQLMRWSGVAAKSLTWVVSIAAMAAVGFGLLRFAWRDPSRELIGHLTILENLETYRSIPDLKFLDDISRIGLFADPAAATSGEEATGEAATDGQPAGSVPGATNPGGSVPM